MPHVSKSAEADALPYALIGAGPMGLAMAKTLVEQGVPFQGFEMHGDVGGLWDIDGPRSTMYETAHLISSKTMTEFTDFPMPAEVAEYPSHREMKRYFQAFARHFDLYRHYRFSAEVLQVEPLGGNGDGWRVRWRDADGGEHEEHFAGVLIANGTLSEPNMPEFEGHFAGELIHSRPISPSAAIRRQAGADHRCRQFGLRHRRRRHPSRRAAICRCGAATISCRNTSSASRPTRWAARSICRCGSNAVSTA